MKKILYVVVFLTLPLLLMASQSDTPVALVNDEAITESAFEETLNRMKILYQDQVDFESEDGAAFLTQLEKSVLEMMIQQKVIFQVAKAEGFLMPLSEAEEEVALIRASFESEAAYLEALEANGLSESSLIRSIQQDSTIEAYFEATISVTPVTEEEVVAFYEEQKAFAQAQQQEVPELEEVFDWIVNQLTEERQRAKANTVVEQLVSEATIERLRS